MRINGKEHVQLELMHIYIFILFIAAVIMFLTVSQWKLTQEYNERVAELNNCTGGNENGSNDVSYDNFAGIDISIDGYTAPDEESS